MQLKLETVKRELVRFAKAYGNPTHIGSVEEMTELIEIYSDELSRFFSEESFSKGVGIAWSKARRFPVVADFFEGYDGREENPQVNPSRFV